MRKILIVDCFDSFTYNLYHCLDKLNKGACDVVRYDAFRPGIASAYSHVVLSPGPAIPENYPLLNEYLEIKSVNQVLLGVCLGHQCMAQYHGAKLLRLKEVMHGIHDQIVAVEESALFNGVDFPAEVGHYHSWLVSEEAFPVSDLRITTRNAQGYIMSIEHNSLPHFGLQFHPESVMTPIGEKVLANWLSL